MKNITVLQLAEKNMVAHNETCGYETFKDILLDVENETLHFVMDFGFMQSALNIVNLLNLSIQIGEKWDDGTNFTITKKATP
ncbi:hypothetical protein LCGC14_2015360 [marine sediment metagenome]|uniref:Uncharacterized protein n=1 Tax=marine sediment metagenome TaxID=412755 RepID=A0A0F9EZ48_9ZZZZ|nr:hypothetical protein [Candidatus Scalindua sp.]